MLLRILKLCGPASPMRFSAAIACVAVVGAALMLADAIAGSELNTWAGEFALTLAFGE